MITKGIAGQIVIERVRVNRQGYDPRGRYFGTGQPVFAVWAHMHDGDNAHGFIRANGARSLARQLRDMPCDARLWRQVFAYGLPQS